MRVGVQRVRRLAGATAAVLVLSAGLTAWQARTTASQLHHTAAVPDDVRALADRTWLATAAALPAHRQCLTGATLDADPDLDERGRYLPDRATLVVRIPATASQLESALIHELAHHIEFTCPDQQLLRADFLAAQGLPTATDWAWGRSWEQTPSEQYAEAMIVLVRGRRSFHRQMHISRDAVTALRTWATGTHTGRRAATPPRTP